MNYMSWSTQCVQMKHWDTDHRKGVVQTAVQGQGFCTLLKLNYYKFDLEDYKFRMLNVIAMATRKKRATENTQKEIRREFKHCT